MEDSTYYGELVLDDSGVYTFAHYYKHHERGRNIILIGTSHAGSQSYFDKMLSILAECELVLSEALGSADLPGDYVGERKEDLFESSGTEAFLAALGVFSIASIKYLDFIECEGDYLITKPESEEWVMADRSLTDDDPDHPPVDELGLDEDKMSQVVEHAREMIIDMENGKFTPEDFARTIFIFNSFDSLNEARIKCLALPRDKHCMSILDEKLEDTDSNPIGIKYGAGHTRNLRKMLEERGFVHERSEKLALVYI